MPGLFTYIFGMPPTSFELGKCVVNSDDDNDDDDRIIT